MKHNTLSLIQTKHYYKNLNYVLRLLIHRALPENSRTKIELNQQTNGGYFLETNFNSLKKKQFLL